MATPPNVKALIDGYRERGEPVPKRYLAPELLLEAKPYLAAFWALEYDRSVGFGSVGGISFTTIDRYAARLGIVDPSEFWTFEGMIRACDAAWLKIVNSEDRGKVATIAAKPISLREMFQGAPGA